jgi:hypothetical protein
VWARKVASGCSSDAIEAACCDLTEPTPPTSLVKAEDDRRALAFHATITPFDPAAAMTDASS